MNTDWIKAKLKWRQDKPDEKAWKLKLTITPEDLERFSKLHGRSSFEYVYKNKRFYDAMTDELGQYIFHDIMNRMDVLFFKIADLKATTEEAVEYKVLKDLFRLWSGRVLKFRREVNNLNEGAINGPGKKPRERAG